PTGPASHVRPVPAAVRARAGRVARCRTAPWRMLRPGAQTCRPLSRSGVATVVDAVPTGNDRDTISAQATAFLRAPAGRRALAWPTVGAGFWPGSWNASAATPSKVTQARHSPSTHL